MFNSPKPPGIWGAGTVILSMGIIAAPRCPAGLFYAGQGTFLIEKIPKNLEKTVLSFLFTVISMVLIAMFPVILIIVPVTAPVKIVVIGAKLCPRQVVSSLRQGIIRTGNIKQFYRFHVSSSL